MTEIKYTNQKSEFNETICQIKKTIFLKKLMDKKKILPDKSRDSGASLILQS